MKTLSKNIHKNEKKRKKTNKRDKKAKKGQKTTKNSKKQLTKREVYGNIIKLTEGSESERGRRREEGTDLKNFEKDFKKVSKNS